MWFGYLSGVLLIVYGARESANAVFMDTETSMHQIFQATVHETGILAIALGCLIITVSVGFGRVSKIMRGEPLLSDPPQYTKPAPSSTANIESKPAPRPRSTLKPYEEKSLLDKIFDFGKRDD